MSKRGSSTVLGMIKAAAAIRGLVHENERLVKETEGFHKFATARQCLTTLIDKRYVTRAEDVLPKLAQLMELPGDKLDLMNQAASLSPAEFAKLGEESEDGTGSQVDVLTRFLMDS